MLKIMKSNRLGKKLSKYWVFMVIANLSKKRSNLRLSVYPADLKNGDSKLLPNQTTLLEMVIKEYILILPCLKYVKKSSYN